MPVGIRFTMSDERVSAELYNRIAEVVNTSDDPPPGLIFHSTGFTGGEAHTFDVWENEESFQAFMKDRLQPEMEKLGFGGSQPDIRIYPLHNVWAVDMGELDRLSYEATPVNAQRKAKIERLQDTVKDATEKATGKMREFVRKE